MKTELEQLKHQLAVVKDDLAHIDEEPYFVVIRNEKLNNMVRA